MHPTQTDKSPDRYSTASVLSKLGKEIIYLEITKFSDGTVVRVKAGTEGSDLYAVCRDERKRRRTTYEKLGLDREEVRSAPGREEFEEKVREWFNEHPGLTVGYDIEKDMEPTGREFLDTHKMALHCREVCHGNVKEDFEYLVKVYRRLAGAERNRIPCVLKDAYYWERKDAYYLEKRRYILFRTSAGTVYYDVKREKWDMSAKERNRTGLVIESFDVGEIREQAFALYRVFSLKELEMRLKADGRATFCAG